MSKRIHLIAIGGSLMHNMAIALKEEGHQISGSDDNFFEPSKSRLAKHGLLPENTGWNPDAITPDIDAIILGMHAKGDNPELQKAKELGLKIYSFPEYIYEHSKNKQRIVIAGSHGKTTVTAMILHALKTLGHDFDYAVGAQLDGFETMVRLSDSAAFIIIEGDEYLTSALDPRPKFLAYKHHIAVLNGIAWDHYNVFPTYEGYVGQFEKLSLATPKAGTIIYQELDPEVKRIAEANEGDLLKFPYSKPKVEIKDGTTYVIHEKEKFPLQIFGEHNLQNLAGAQKVCERLCVAPEDFYKAMQSFTGAGRRLEKLSETADKIVFRDFAHSPSKVKAVTEAVKAQYPNKSVTACLELHSFSSLNKEFIGQYKGAMDSVDTAIVYFNPKTVASKNLEPITDEQIQQAFGRQDVVVVSDSSILKDKLNEVKGVSLLMSSGNFDNIELT